ncbi:hypothetical protein CLV42_10547 [Chitinophaga ginsengisoli]|uniref:Uncharacterized protein n=1 Tax=Chitinophaga ginsengisoli TaxID=363837 RepID=A0A2P8G9N4_9BACT|nr:hypothetical protein CLV42_10547 [Chitinophaga ginsengisoli]
MPAYILTNDFYRIAPLMSVSGKSTIACSATVVLVALATVTILSQISYSRYLDLLRNPVVS